MNNDSKIVIDTGIGEFFESPVFEDIRTINEHFSSLFAPLNETKDLFKWLDNLPKIAFDTWGTNISNQSVEVLKEEFKTKGKTIQDIEEIIYSMSKTNKHKVAEIVCLLFVFGIADMINVTKCSKMISERTGYRRETIRLYLGRFKTGIHKNPQIQISMNKNLAKAEKFTTKHEATHLLKESIKQKKK